MKLSTLPQPVGLLKLMLDLYMISIQGLGFSQCDSCFLGDHPKPNASTGGG